MHCQWEVPNTTVTMPVDRLWHVIAQRTLLGRCYVPTGIVTVVFGTSHRQCITGVKNGENRGRDGRVLTPNERVLTFRVCGVKFHRN